MILTCGEGGNLSKRKNVASMRPKTAERGQMLQSGNQERTKNDAVAKNSIQRPCATEILDAKGTVFFRRRQRISLQKKKGLSPQKKKKKKGRENAI